MIEIQEGCELFDSLNDIAVKESSTVAGDVDREKELLIAEIERK